MIQKIMAVCLLVITVPGYAQVEKIDTDRPDQTESTVIVPKHWVQLELGLSKQANTASSDEFQHPTLLSKYGIGKKVELRLITTLLTNTFKTAALPTQKECGLAPIELGAKVALWEEKKWIPKTSLIFHVAFPKLASQKFKADKVAPNFRFSMQNTFSKTMAIGYNVGAEWDGYSNAATWIYTFAPGFNISEKWYGYIEAFGFIAKEQSPQHTIDGGFAYYINSNLKLDISSGFGISAAAPKWYVAIGGSIRFNTAKK